VSKRRSPPAAPAAKDRDDPSGRIAFRLRICVTGHRSLDAPEKIAARVREQLERLVGLLHASAPEDLGRQVAARVRQELKRLFGLVPAEGSTTVGLAVISQLAEGADRLVVREALAAANPDYPARLEVVLPMRRDVYARVQGFGDASRGEFDELMRQAILVTVVRHPGDGDGASPGAYQAASRSVVRSCDIVLAIWDGQPTGGKGGTAETLQAAAAGGKPCVWIPTDPAEPVRDNLAPGTSYDFYQQVTALAQVPEDCAGTPRERGELPEDVLKPLRESLELLERYNGERRPAGFGQRLEAEFGSPGGREDWIAPYYLRATLLAAENQKRFTWSARAIALLAIIAAVMLGVHLTLSSNPAWGSAEVVSLVAVTLIFVILRELEFHDRWISYRFLAERLRSARFLIPAGVNLQLPRTTVAAYIERHPSDWVQRAFDEFWHGDRRREQRKRHETDVVTLKRRLADDWIGDQIRYHQKRSKEHQKWQRILQVTILILFAAAVICAVLDAIKVSRNVTGCLSVAFPAAAASLGALLTVRQHRQLAERSEKMSKDLEEERLELEKAEGRRELASTGARAARIMADESEDWLGALWFLDVEHPG
jgi:SMODS and SLOG-associating 2TM effector domain 1